VGDRTACDERTPSSLVCVVRNHLQRADVRAGRVHVFVVCCSTRPASWGAVSPSLGVVGGQLIGCMAGSFQLEKSGLKDSKHRQFARTTWLLSIGIARTGGEH